MKFSIRENITPRGDGNCVKIAVCSSLLFFYKREYNSERRRKHTLVTKIYHSKIIIRENITPRGDGNKKDISFLSSSILVYKREYNSERRRKLIHFFSFRYFYGFYKREYNSERRRKLYE